MLELCKGSPATRKTNLIFFDNKYPLFTRLWGGFTERGQCHLFYRSFIAGLPFSCEVKRGVVVCFEKPALLCLALSCSVLPAEPLAYQC